MSASPASVVPAPPAPSLARRIVASVRVEELLTLSGLILFWVLGHTGISRFDLWTQFFREGLLFYLGVGGLVVVVEGWRRREALSRVGRYAAQLGGVLVRFLRDWAPFILLLTIYENLIWFVHRVNPRLYDPALQQVDELITLGHDTFWLERFVTAGRTEWFSFFYNILFVYPVLIGGVLYVLRRFGPFRRWVLVFSLAGYLGYLGYLLVPVIGPAYYYESVYRSDLAGNARGLDDELLGRVARSEGEESGDAMAFYRLARRLNRPPGHAGQVPRNCFPSLHTAWGLLILAFCYRHLRPLFWIVLFPVANLIAATVYLRFHYAIDLVAGAMLTLLVLTLVPHILALEERLRAAVLRAP